MLAGNTHISRGSPLESTPTIQKVLSFTFSSDKRKHTPTPQGILIWWILEGNYTDTNSFCRAKNNNLSAQRTAWLVFGDRAVGTWYFFTKGSHLIFCIPFSFMSINCKKGEEKEFICSTWYMQLRDIFNVGDKRTRMFWHLCIVGTNNIWCWI